MKNFLLGFSLLSLFCCTNDEAIVPEYFKEFDFVIPNGWTSIPNIDYYPNELVVDGLESPDAVLVFVNRDTTFYNFDQQTNQHPSLVLNFFDISKISQIDSILSHTILLSKCVALPYDTTAEFFIVTSKCLQNHGFYSTEANNLIAPLHQSLHTYFNTKQ